MSAARGVEVREVPPFAPYWREGFAWKPWILRHLDADRLVYVDAGATVLRPLDEALAQIDERGYWVVSQQHPVAPMVPPDYWERLGVDPAIGGRETVAAGIVGFSRPSAFFERVIVPTYEDCLGGLSLGFSSGEVKRLNVGLNASPSPTLHDCPNFRWDQTLLNLRFHAAYAEPFLNDHDRFAGKTPDAHPEQAIWAHRRRGDLRYLGRVRYRMPTALVGRPYGTLIRARWWLRLHRWLFRPSTYAGKARRIVARTRGAA